MLTARFLILVVTFAITVVGSVPRAAADVSIIATPNSTLSGTPGPYATVTYVLNGSNIDAVAQMFPGFATFGLADMFGFNVVGSTIGLSVTNMPAGFTSNVAGAQMDGFGTFEVVLGCCTLGNAVTSFSFTVSRTGGFSSASQLFESNATGAHFAMHVAPINGNPIGFAADGGTPSASPVPEPACLVLLSLGSIGMGLSGRLTRRR